MITLALDEFGSFEGIRNDDKPIGIAGILYDDTDDKADLLNERKRIANYYKACIESVGNIEGKNREFQYPGALHSNGSKGRDKEVVKPVKRKVNATLREFLVSGTFEGKELLNDSKKRMGKYYVFAIVKSDRGMTSLMADSVNFLVKDDQGSNLYFHMASEVVSRMLFHNPFIPNIRGVELNIATRRSDDMEPDSREAGEYYAQGYIAQNSLNPNHSGQVYFGIANADIYRSVLSQEFIRCGKTQIRVNDFFVKPIRYATNAQNMEFLYLSDSVCTFLSNNINGDSDVEKLKRIVDKANQINDKSCNMIFGYDEIDTMYQKAWELYELGDYFESLRICYDAGLLEGGYSEHYRGWFDHIRKMIMSDGDEARFTRAVRSLHDTIKTNTLNQDRTVYILETLEKMAPEVEKRLDDTESRDILYRLYDTGVTAYCHIGNSKQAIHYYKLCKKYASRVGVEEYLETLNKMSEVLLDNFEWKTAEKIAEDSIRFHEELLKMRNALPVYAQENQQTSVGLCKAYSQKGQVYAFLRKPEAETCFRKALDGFSKESADYKITQSYLLHYYLDCGMEKEYREESKIYFGNEESPRSQFEYILSEGFKETPIFNYKYAIYVYLRGIYSFRLDEISDKLKERLYDIDTQISKAEIRAKGKKNASFVKLTGHPSEIIFKYLSLIAYEKGDLVMSEKLKERIDTCLRYTGNTIELINMYSKIEIAIQRNDEDIDERYADAYRFMAEQYVAIQNRDDLSKEEMRKTVDRYISFMYR